MQLQTLPIILLHYVAFDFVGVERFWSGVRHVADTITCWTASVKVMEEQLRQKSDQPSAVARGLRLADYRDIRRKSKDDSSELSTLEEGRAAENQRANLNAFSQKLRTLRLSGRRQLTEPHCGGSLSADDMVCIRGDTLVPSLKLSNLDLSEYMSLALSDVPPVKMNNLQLEEISELSDQCATSALLAQNVNDADPSPDTVCVAKSFAQVTGSTDVSASDIQERRIECGQEDKSSADLLGTVGVDKDQQDANLINISPPIVAHGKDPSTDKSVPNQDEITKPELEKNKTRAASKRVQPLRVASNSKRNKKDVLEVLHEKQQQPADSQSENRPVTNKTEAKKLQALENPHGVTLKDDGMLHAEKRQGTEPSSPLKNDSSPRKARSSKINDKPNSSNLNSINNDAANATKAVHSRSWRTRAESSVMASNASYYTNNYSVPHDVWHNRRCRKMRFLNQKPSD